MVARSLSTSTRASGSVTVGDPNSNQTTPTDTRFSEETMSDDGEEDNVDENPDEPIEGWPRVALLMAKTPDFAAFSRFRDLNVKSLLYYQAQLTTLRFQLHKAEYKDLRRGENHAARADIMMDDAKSEQFQIMTEIRKVLREYSELATPDPLFTTNDLINRTDEALLQYSQISALPQPESYNMKNFRRWLRHEGGANMVIGGKGEQHTWGDLRKDPFEGKPGLWKQFWRLIWNFIWTQPQSSDDLDLVATRPSGKIDGFTRWVAGYLIPFYKEFCQYREQRKEDKRKNQGNSDAEKNAKNTTCIPFYGELHEYHKRRKEEKIKRQPRSKGTRSPDPKNWVKKVEKGDTIETWSEKGMLRFTSGVSTVIACLLPVVAITVLSQVHGTRNLLLCLASFAVIFAVGLIFLTNGTSSRVEIFTATSASVPSLFECCMY